MTVNEDLGAWSQLFMLLAAMTYLVAFVAFAWDMASHSKILRRARPEQHNRSEGQLVGAATTATVNTVEADDSRAGLGTGDRGRGYPASAQSVLAEHVADSSMRYTGTRRPAAQAAVTVMVLAFALRSTPPTASTPRTSSRPR